MRAGEPRRVVLALEPGASVGLATREALALAGRLGASLTVAYGPGTQLVEAQRLPSALVRHAPRRLSEVERIALELRSAETLARGEVDRIARELKVQAAFLGLDALEEGLAMLLERGDLLLLPVGPDRAASQRLARRLAPRLPASLMLLEPAAPSGPGRSPEGLLERHVVILGEWADEPDLSLLRAWTPHLALRTRRLSVYEPERLAPTDAVLVVRHEDAQQLLGAGGVIVTRTRCVLVLR